MSRSSIEIAAAATAAAVIVPWERHDADRAADARLAEAVALAGSIRLEVLLQRVVPLRQRRPSTLFGTGQLDTLRGALSEYDIEVVVVDGPLSPVQQRNLERAWDCKVIDRTGLILDIFGDRAATREGSLQVELAHLEYQRSRLVRSWTHLERQRGGFGFLGGPGETQIEADRRLIGERLVRLRHEIEQVRRTRGLHRLARHKVPFPVVALVGYTNAGKSTLFNALTGADVSARDQLFATLDPTTRGLRLPSGRRVILSDTVGFISELPTELVAAFRATLEEVAEADLILHVRDASHPDTLAQRNDTMSVLDGMVASGTLDAEWRQRMLEVLNKIDLVESGTRPSRIDGIAVSALTGKGMPALLAGIEAGLLSGTETAHYRLQVTEGARIAWLYEHGEVIGRVDDEQHVDIQVRLLPSDRSRFERHPA